MADGPRQSGSETYQWVSITDFSPGCYDGSHISTETAVDTAPLGAAYLPNTYACASIPGGALGPLPGRVTTLPLSTIGGIPGSSPYALIAGFIIIPQLNDGGYETVTIVEADNGTDHYVRVTSYEAGVTNTLTGPDETTATTPGFFGAPYPIFTRMTVTGSGNPPPVLAFPTAVGTDGSGASGHLWIYPELLSPTSFTAQDLIVSHSSTTGQLIAYDSRILALVGIDYSHPTGGGINTNENINFTDPPLSDAYGNQMTVLGAEIPWGYGAWGSVSVGELLLIKKYGGALQVFGDIFAPSSVVQNPGVQSTGDLVGQARVSSIGLVYCSQNQGAWVWNGGNTAQKISSNINDSFFDLQTNNITSNNYGFNVYQWQKWVLFSGNVIYDTETGVWWKLFPPKGTNPTYIGPGQDIWWYSLTQNGNQIAVSPLRCTSNSDPWLSIFDNTVPSEAYQWQSLPIHVSAHGDRLVNVREIIVRASDPTNTGVASVTVDIASFSQASFPTVTIGLEPTPIRFNVGQAAARLDDIIVTLIAQNQTGAAPIIHSIDIGYDMAQEIAPGKLMGKLSTKVKNLLIPRKTQDPVGQPDYGTDARAIEAWAAQVGLYAGTIQEIVAGANVTVTNGNGPVVTVAASPGGGYASFGGPGQTTSPGDLTQNGNLLVNSSYALEANTVEGLSGATLFEILLASHLGFFIQNLAGAYVCGIGSSGFTQATIEAGTTNCQCTNFYVDFSGGGGGPYAFQVHQVLGNTEIGFYQASPVTQPAAVTHPSGGTTVDTQARTAIVSLINVLSAAGGGNGLTA